MKKSTLFCLLIILVGFFIIINPLGLSAESPEINNIILDVSSEKDLFNVENMKPGDWAHRHVEVCNKGEGDFEYQLFLKNNHEEKLFNELMLEINDNHGELYRGKLADFTSLSLRSLKGGSKEELQMTIRFPEHLGNDFQGLKVYVSLIFTAKGDKVGGSNLEVNDDGKTGSTGNS